MHMRRVGGIRARALFACAAIGAVIVACGGTIEPAAGESSSKTPGGSPAAGTGADPSSERDGGGDVFGADAGDADAASDSGAVDAGWKDDPCPPKVDINCSTSCGGLTEWQKVKRCGPNSGSSSPTLFLSDEVPSLVVRTPSSLEPLMDAFRCTQTCDGVTPLYSLTARVLSLTSGFRVRVEPPWVVVALRTSSDDVCYGPRRSCESMSAGRTFSVVVATEDSNAPARNVIIEATTEPCPGEPF